ncbi:AraC family transcriptional regulator [Salipiger sp. H15]|uniref:AraC family transcriptional regulator n=1 Tax=Alloyangia sp. H15 TaxID=3029062 RepID=A0AAU8ALF0_9RHOB
MDKQQIKRLIAERIHEDGLMETGVEGVRLFRATTAIPCAPAVYEPSIIAIVSGTKEAVLDGARHVYDESRYLCCPISMPVTAGTPHASPDEPLLGVYISLDQRVMTELVMAMEGGTGAPLPKSATVRQGMWFSRWDESFSDALLRLLKLARSPADTAALGAARLRELYYAILQGEAGPAARQAFAPGNAIARSIAHLSSNLSAQVTIDEMAARAGMSRAVFHRRFKSATTMSPIQFVKAMRLNSAAMKIAGGMTVNQAAIDVGYVSLSQFSREFRRMHGQSPRQWSNAQRLPLGMA